MADGARRRRVPYEWILGAMFVGSFALCWSFFLARAVWLLVVGPVTGLSLGVGHEAGASPPRRWPLLVVAAPAALYCVGGFLAFWNGHLAYRLMAVEWWPAPVALSFLGLVVSARQPGRHGEAGVFANAALLLLLGFGYDVIWAPKH